MTDQTTTETLTDTQTRNLLAEAGAAGDLETVRHCEWALRGDEAARAEVARVISDAEAMDND